MHAATFSKILRSCEFISKKILSNDQKFEVRKLSENSDLYSMKSFFFSLNRTKIVGGWGSAPDPAGGAYSAPPEPLAVMG